MPSLIHHVRRHADKWVSIFVGTTVFLVLVGPQTLWPASTTWLRWGDSAQHYYGWEFFRRSPLLQFPLGNSPRFGVGYSSSIVYTDSIPLLAIPLKYLTFWFDADFQYFGLWLLFCFIAQHYFAQLILIRLGVSRLLATVSAVFLLVSPVFLFRQTIGGFGHFALVGHFLILAAIALALESRYAKQKWLGLAIVALLVQFYLFAMVVVIWLMQAIGHAMRAKLERRTLVLGFLQGVVAIILVMWMSGYFSSGNSEEEGYGIFRADLATFVDPMTYSITPWSRLLPDQPVQTANTDGTFEGFAFLGLGILFAIPIVIISLATVRRRLSPLGSLQFLASRLIWLLAACLICFVFSLSNRVTFRTEVLVLKVPAPFEIVTNSLRTSGRFVWPLAYLITLMALVLVAGSLSKRGSLVLVAALLGTQLLDSRNALTEHRERFTEYQYPRSLLASSDWDQLAHGRKLLIVNPPPSKDVWQDFAEFALNNEMSTNVAYLSRVNYEKVATVVESQTESLRNLALESTVLYVVTSRSGAYETLMQRMKANSGELAPGLDARLIDGMLAIVVKL